MMMYRLRACLAAVRALALALTLTSTVAFAFALALGATAEREQADDPGRSVLLSLLGQEMHRAPCKLRATFYPNGQWRLGRGFGVDAGNVLPSSQTHYKPRVFLDCPADPALQENEKQRPSSNRSRQTPQSPLLEGSATVVLFSVLPPSAAAGAAAAGRTIADGEEEPESAVMAVDSLQQHGWLHWLVEDFPLGCGATGGCHATLTPSTSGIPMQTDQGRVFAEFVPPGVAELRPDSAGTARESGDQGTSPQSVYVVALYSGGIERSARSSSTTFNESAQIEATSSSAAVRANILGDLTTGELLGINFFQGAVDGLAHMQFHDVKSATHGIVHSSTLAAQKDEL